jgi:hypothetical protein
MEAATPTRQPRTGTGTTQRSPAQRTRSTRAATTHSSSGDRVRVRREQRFSDDGFRTQLVPGLRSTQDAERLAEEVGFAAARLAILETEPPGLYGRLLDDDLEQATWTCLLIAYLGPLQGDEPFAAIEPIVTAWETGELPQLDGVEVGPRSSHEAARGNETLVAYRNWAARAGSQADAFMGDEQWTDERRFERVFERLALPGLSRAGRFDMLVTLGRLGLYPLRAGTLHLVGDDPTTVAAKRAFGIGDRDNLERRARALADEAEIPLEALDLALTNWAAPERITLGVPADSGDDDAHARVLGALGL